MKAALAAALLLCLAIPAEARSSKPEPSWSWSATPQWQYAGQQRKAKTHARRVHRAKRHRSARRHVARHGSRGRAIPLETNLVTIPTAAGKITVSPAFAEKIVPFIADVVALGFKGAVHCFATGGHVPRSYHYRGRACDFAQRARNKTHSVMYAVGDLARKYGLTDGCTFRNPDCGHLQMDGRVYATARSKSRHASYARRGRGT